MYRVSTRRCPGGRGPKNTKRKKSTLRTWIWYIRLLAQSLDVQTHVIFQASLVPTLGCKISTLNACQVHGSDAVCAGKDSRFHSSMSAARRGHSSAAQAPRGVLAAPPLEAAWCATSPPTPWLELGQGHRDCHPSVPQHRTEASLASAAGTACVAASIVCNNRNGYPPGQEHKAATY